MSSNAIEVETEESVRRAENGWVAAMLSTTPADRPAADAAVVRLYESLGLPAPRRTAWASGPIELAALREGATPVDCGRNLMPIVGDRLAHADCTLADGARHHPLFRRRQMLVETYGGLRQSVATLVDRESARGATGRRILRRVVSWMTGRHDPSQWRMLAANSRSQLDGLWLAAQEHLYRRYGLIPRHHDTLEALVGVLSSAGWLAPHEHCCWLSERPEVLRIDARNRLHAPNGPALRYRDGLEVHSWKGVQIPAWLTSAPETITVGRINRESDPFVRRCMIEIMTPERFISAGGARVMSRDETGTLWTKSWGFDAWAAVEVVNGTPEPDGSRKHYFLQVPPEMQTARQAVAWTYDLTETQYARLVLRT